MNTKNYFLKFLCFAREKASNFVGHAMPKCSMFLKKMYLKNNISSCWAIREGKFVCNLKYPKESNYSFLKRFTEVSNNKTKMKKKLCSMPKNTENSLQQKKGFRIKIWHSTSDCSSSTFKNDLLT